MGNYISSAVGGIDLYIEQYRKTNVKMKANVKINTTYEGFVLSWLHCDSHNPAARERESGRTTYGQERLAVKKNRPH